MTQIFDWISEKTGIWGESDLKQRRPFTQLATTGEVLAFDPPLRPFPARLRELDTALSNSSSQPTNEL
jgi:hypothetical protein